MRNGWHPTDRAGHLIDPDARSLYSSRLITKHQKDAAEHLVDLKLTLSGELWGTTNTKERRLIDRNGRIVQKYQKS